MQNGSHYTFGEFRFDPKGRVLFRSGEIVPLFPKAMEVLACLLESHGQVTTKEELLAKAWPDTFVEESTLTRSISVLRRALGDTPDGHTYISTVPKRGYRFVAPVHEEATNGDLSLPRPIARIAEGLQPSWIRAILRRDAIALISGGVLAILVTAAGFVYWARSQAKGTGAPRLMLAVLPVQNLTGDPGREYISDGLTEEMIAQLGNLNPPQLGVIARTSSMAYKKTDRTVEQIGRELGVDYVLEASLREAGDRMRVTAQLIRVGDQTHLWAHDYDGAIHEVIGLQDEVALAVARQIHLQLTALAGERMARNQRTVPAAQDAYLKGRFYWNTRSKEGLWKSVEYFQQAIKVDPMNAEAYAGLADAYNMLVFYGYFRGAAGVLNAKAAADSALERDDSLAEGHAALAYVNFMWLWDWPAAEREFRRATELGPNYAPAHHWYALYLAAMGRQREAIEEISLARRLDPLSPNVKTAVGYVYYFARQYDQSIKECQEVLRQAPDFMVAHAVLGLAYEGKGNYANAITELQRAIELSGDRTSAYLGWLGHAYALSGRRADAEKILNELDDLARHGFLGSSHRAVIYAGLGEQDKALQFLHDARDQDDAALIWLRVDPHYDPLRANAGFQELVKVQGNGR